MGTTKQVGRCFNVRKPLGQYGGRDRDHRRRFPRVIKGAGSGHVFKGKQKKGKRLEGKRKGGKKGVENGGYESKGRENREKSKKKGPKRRTKGTAGLEKLRLGETTP